MNVVPWLIDGDDEFPSARIKSVKETERYDLESGACLKSQHHSDDFDGDLPTSAASAMSAKEWRM